MTLNLGFIAPPRSTSTRNIEYAIARIEERERACDEGELRLGSERERTNGAGKRNEGSANEPARHCPQEPKAS